MMTKVIFPGTFDPPTLGHLDIAKRAVEIFDHVYIAVGSNIRKKKTTFSIEERVEFLKTITKNISNIEIVAFDGLLVDFANHLKVSAILRSIRNVSDFDYENLQAQMNRQLGNIETIYMMADEKYRLISSTLIREIAYYGKRLHAFVPAEIEELIFHRLHSPST